MGAEIITPTELKGLAKQAGLSPSKKYGQNYLINGGIIDKIVDAADIDTKDIVVEVGPGFGTLTFALAKQAKKIVAFEIEKKLEEYWEEKQQEHKNIEIVWGNVLHQFDSKALPKKYKVVANLPYQITSHAIRTFLEVENPPTSLTLMVQKEVADRITAKAGDMSLLAVSVQYFGQPKMVTKVSRGSFWPTPKVDSAVITIENLKARPEKEHFFTVVRAGFANKRKQLWRNLHTGLGTSKEDAQSIVEEITGNPKIRAEALNIDQWIELAGELKKIS